MEPDLAGFRDAQERKRRAFSEPIVLLGPVEASYPPGTAMDPETGEPYDPTVTATASARASAVIDAEFVWQSTQDPEDPSPVGRLDTQHPMLIAASAAASAVEGKSHFEARGSEFEIRATHFDGITGVDRLLIYGALT